MLVGQLHADAGGERPGAGQLALRGHVVRQAEDQADPGVPEGVHVPHRLFRGSAVVAGDPREGQVVDRGVDQDGGQVALGQPAIVLVPGVALGVEAAGEHDTGDVLLQQQLDVVGLRDAAGGLGAQHGGEPLLGKCAADDVGERREDRVLQLGQHQADQSGPLARSLVGRSYPRTSSAVSTACRVASETPGLPLRTRLTVASLTPTLVATSASRLDMMAMLAARK